MIVAVGRMFDDDEGGTPFASLRADLPTDSASEPLPLFVRARRQEVSEVSKKVRQCERAASDTCPLAGMMDESRT